MKRLKQAGCITMVCFLLMAVGCQPTPKQAYIVNKTDFEEKLQQTEESPTDVEEYAEELPEFIRRTFEKTKVKITMEADVICEVDYDKIPVYKFRKAVLPQEKMREWVKYFAGDAKLYSWPTVYTKAYYQERIIEAKKGFEVDGKFVINEEYIEELRDRYDEAPEGNERHYISAEYDYIAGNPDAGKVRLEAAAEAEGDDFTLFANTRERGAKRGSSAFQCNKGLQVISEIYIYDELKEQNGGYGSYEEDLRKIEIGTITEEDAKTKANQLLADLGITGMKLVKSGRACLESFDNQFGIDSDRPEIGGRELLYMRNISGVTIDPDVPDILETTEIVGENGARQTAPSIVTEKIRIFVSNDGDVETFDYSGMLEEGEKLSEAVALMPFEDIVGRAADQLYFENSFLDEGMTSEIEIDSISLVMTYAPAKNDFDSVLLIPAWRFSGIQTITSAKGRSTEQAVSVTVNAVDGSRA